MGISLTIAHQILPLPELSELDSCFLAAGLVTPGLVGVGFVGAVFTGAGFAVRIIVPLEMQF